MKPRSMLEPELGYWLIRLVKNGPLMPACIVWHETLFEPDYPENRMDGTRPRFLSAMIADEVVSLDRVWLTKGEEITEAEYKWRCADRAWALEYASDEAIANPRKPVDRATIPLPF